MTLATASIVSLGVATAFGLGVAVGPRAEADAVRPGVAVITPAPAASAVVTAPAPARTAPRLELMPTASAKPVQEHVKQLLARGANVQKAAAGFANAYELMTVAHAARNTDIPFVVLKQRVLTERKSLADAIGEFKPELDEAAEVTRARAEARADLARLSD